MSKNPAFSVSQEFEVIVPRSGRAYPIPCEEWDKLKELVARISDESAFFHDFAMLILGVGVASLVAILTGAVQNDPKGTQALTISWCVVVCSFVCGALSLHFAKRQRSATRVNAVGVVTQMKIIEVRYEQSGG